MTHRTMSERSTSELRPAPLGSYGTTTRASPEVFRLFSNCTLSSLWRKYLVDAYPFSNVAESLICD